MTITPSSPARTQHSTGGNKPSKIRQPSTVSPSRSATVTPSSSSPPAKKKSIEPDSVDEIDSSKSSNPNHITLSDDIFIHHTHSHQVNSAPPHPHAGGKSFIPVRSPTHSTNGDKNNGNNNRAPRNNVIGAATPVTGNPFGPVVATNRKNFEAFVMTGDAILNISKLKNEDSIR